MTTITKTINKVIDIIGKTILILFALIFVVMAILFAIGIIPGLIFGIIPGIISFILCGICGCFAGVFFGFAFPEQVKKYAALRQIMKIRKSQQKYLIEKSARGENLTDSEQSDLSQGLNRPIDVDEVNRIAKNIPSVTDGDAPKEMMQYIYYVGGFLVVVIGIACLSM